MQFSFFKDEFVIFAHVVFVVTCKHVLQVRGDIIQAYKIMTGKDKIDREQFFQLADSNYYYYYYMQRLG